MSNKFWGGGSSSSDDTSTEPSEESVSSNESGSGDDAPNNRYYDSSSSGDEKRVMKSKKDKASETLNLIVSNLNKALAANDWLNTLEHWNALLKQEKPLLQALPALPVAFVRSLVKVDDLVQSMTKAKLAELNGNHHRAFSRMRTGVKKQVTPFEALMKAYREKPQEEDDDAAESESGSSDDGKDTPASTAKAPAKKPAKHSWFKKDDDKDGDSSGSESDSDSEEDSEEDQEVKGKKPREKTKKVIEEINWTSELVDEKIAAYFAHRSKRARGDRKVMLKNLRFLSTKAHNNLQTLKITVSILYQIFDHYSSVDAIIPQQLWQESMYLTKAVIDLIESDHSLKDRLVYEAFLGVQSSEDDDYAGAMRILSFVEKLGDSLLRSFQETDPHSVRYLNLLRNESRYHFVCVLAQRFFEKRNNYEALCRVILRHLDLLYYKRDEYDTAPLPIPAPLVTEIAAFPSTPSQTAASSDEDKSDEDSVSDDGDQASAARSSRSVLKKSAEIDNSPRELPVEPGTPSISERIQVLAAIVYKHGLPAAKTQALLMSVYHHAIHDRFTEARNMILMSHLQDCIGGLDISIQILFNRAMVQLGLAAFRTGLISDAHSCLMDLYSSMRPNHKELLAQGLSKLRFGVERPPEKESLEKRRQVPYHKHISLEAVESIHLISALLLQVPYLAAHQYDVKHRSLSRTFSRLIGMSERQLWGVGPAESSRDFIISATKKLTSGDWQSAADILLKLSCWKHIRNAEAVKTMLLRKIQEVALRTFIFSYTAYYDSVSIEKLSLLFQLSQAEVHRLLSKMIIDGELHASHHQPTNSIVLHRVEPTRLQSLALQFADKVSTLVEQTDRSTDNRPSYMASGFDPLRRGRGSSERSRGGSYRGGSRGSDRGGRGSNMQQSNRRIAGGSSSNRRGSVPRGSRGSRGVSRTRRG
ncbi:MAG: PCI domain-containing protein [archaeon]|nr:PCI domain-containing protein [archaeon]